MSRAPATAVPVIMVLFMVFLPVVVLPPCGTGPGHAALVCAPRPLSTELRASLHLRAVRLLDEPDSRFQVTERRSRIRFRAETDPADGEVLEPAEPVRGLIIGLLRDPADPFPAEDDVTDREAVFRGDTTRLGPV